MLARRIKRSACRRVPRKTIGARKTSGRLTSLKGVFVRTRAA